jgi:hypothetical protein
MILNNSKQLNWIEEHILYYEFNCKNQLQMSICIKKTKVEVAGTGEGKYRKGL